MPKAMCPFCEAVNKAKAGITMWPFHEAVHTACRHFYDYGKKDGKELFTFRHWLRGFRTVEATPDDGVLVKGASE